MKRIQVRRGVGLPDGAKYVGRGSRWGNRYRIGELNPERDGPSGPMSRQTVVALYRPWAVEQLRNDPTWLEPLRDHDLACWCDPADGLPCHADVLLELLAFTPGLDDYFPPRGPCFACGRGDARHRVIDSIRENVAAGDSVEMVAEIYERPIEAIRFVVALSKRDYRRLVPIAR